MQVFYGNECWNADNADASQRRFSQIFLKFCKSNRNYILFGNSLFHIHSEGFKPLAMDMEGVFLVKINLCAK